MNGNGEARGRSSSGGAGLKEMREEKSTTSVDSFWQLTDDETRLLLKQELQSVEGCATAMRKKLSKSDRAELRNTSATDLEDLMHLYMERADQSKEIRKPQNEAGDGKRSMSTFLNNFNEYVKAYSGVIQVMEGAGFGYGKAANGALQLFLIYAVNKEKTEDFIDKMLVELRQQYYRIQMLKDVFPTKRMKEYTAVLYRLGIEFLYETVRYYSMGTVRRLGHIIARPPSMGVEKKVTEIKDAIRETEREMRALDSVKIDEMKQDQRDMRQDQKDMKRKQEEDGRTLGELSTILNALQIRTDNDRLEMLRRMLHLDMTEVVTDIPRYEAMLDETFLLRRLPPLDVEAKVFAHPACVSWRRGKKSSLFLLHGSTMAPYQTTCSWLSPAAVRMVSHFDEIFNSNSAESMTSPILTYYLYRPPETISAERKKATPANVISSIIFQLLGSEGGKRIIRDEENYAFVQQSLDALEEISAQQVTERCRKLGKILNKIVVELELKCLVVVVDRVDQLHGGLEKAVEILKHMMESTKTNVKTFLTARSRNAFDDTDMKEELGSRYTRLTINQDD